MIGVCSRNLYGCVRTWETSAEDAGDPGGDLQGPECPACYRRRKSMGIKDGVQGESQTPAISPSLKAAPTHRDSVTAAVVPLISHDLFDAATLAAILVFMVLPTVVIASVYARDWWRQR